MFGTKVSAHRAQNTMRKTRTTVAAARGVTLRIQKGRSKSNDKDSLWLDVHEGGVRRKEFLGLYLTGHRESDRENILLAEQLKSRRIRQATLKRAGLTEIEFRPEDDFMTFYRHLASSRGNAWKNVLAHLDTYLNHSIRFGDISEKWIDGFKQFLSRKGLAQNSIATYLDVLKTSLNIAVKQKIIPVNPFVYADPIRRHRTQREFLTEKELVILFNTKCQHAEVRKAFLFACLTGLRISDLRALTWKCIRSTEVRFTQKKTGDVTAVPLAPQALDLLGDRDKTKPNGLVFAFPSRDDVFNDRLLRWVKDAGIEKHITSHSARHTFATLLITMGNDLYAVQHLLGHRDIKVTQVYAKLVDERKVRAIMSLPLIGTSS